MSKGFLKRSALQLIVSAGQIVTLALFIVLFPRMATSPADWAAGYFLSLAVTTPIFMFFGFELRKRTAAHEGESVVELNKQRTLGVLGAVLTSLTAYIICHSIGLFSDFHIFTVIVLFKVAQAINDQITANYEWMDAFRISALSGSLRVLAFVPVAAGASMLFGPNAGIVIGTLAFPLIWVLFDARHGIHVTSWIGKTALYKNQWFAGLGAFIISLTVNAPRIVVSMLFGEAALIVMGVGQSLNRIGQVISGSLVQTLLAVRRKVGSQGNNNHAIVVAAQVFILVVLVALLPLWETVFDYASDAPEFTLAMSVLLIFGFASQINYFIQSLLLISKGGAVFAASPLYFLIFLTLGTGGLWITGQLEFLPFLILLIISRIAQIILNFWKLRTPKT